jgi:hypothetical protein
VKGFNRKVSEGIYKVRSNIDIMKIEKSCNHCETLCITCDRRKKIKTLTGIP